MSNAHNKHWSKTSQCLGVTLGLLAGLTSSIALALCVTLVPLNTQQGSTTRVNHTKIVTESKGTDRQKNQDKKAIKLKQS